MNRKNMKKIHLIFLSLIVLEIILLILSSTLLTRSSCGSPCDTNSLLNPFGYEKEGRECISAGVCLPNPPHPLTYLIADLLILTILTYIIILIINKRGKKKNVK